MMIIKYSKTRHDALSRVLCADDNKLIINKKMEMSATQALAEVLAIRIERFQREMVKPSDLMTRQDVKKALLRVMEYVDNGEIAGLLNPESHRSTIVHHGFEPNMNEAYCIKCEKENNICIHCGRCNACHGYK